MSNNLVTSEHFHDLFKRDVPFLDIRAKSEFDKGHFPTSHNLPILNDEERKVVGICFKEKGQEAAIKLGHSLVLGDIKEKRIKAWCEFVQLNKNTHLYCWRGGMRSNFANQWMREAGVEIPMIRGGFKSLRSFLIKAIEDASIHVPIVRISGKTGTSKTVLVNAIEFSTDLEGHANHRGSSFGRRVSGVQTQVNFENSLAIDLLKKRDLYPNRTLIIEDESRRIGNCVIPKTFLDAMHSSQIGIIEMPLDIRIEHISQEYVIEMHHDFQELYPESGWELFVEYLTQSLFRVQKRLGTECYLKIRTMMDKALKTQSLTGATSDHVGWIKSLLTDYYDPMYEYQLSKHTKKIVFRGPYDEVLEWAKVQSNI